MANLVNYGDNSTPVTGGLLAHNTLAPVGRAFLAADIYAGAKHPTNLMMTQSAYLARVNVTYAWWAHKRRAERAAIEAGLVPLVPARLKVTVPVGCTLPAVVVQSTTNGESIDDTDAIINFVRRIGVERTLQAAMVVEAAQ